VRMLELRADHRPERAGGESTLPIDKLRANGPFDKPVLSNVEGLRANGSVVQPFPIRPLWLLSSPQPLGTDPIAAEIRLESGPERIETGWWDGFEVGRDYFVGRNARGEALWLYRERGGEWFVHGVFA
jgi:hypothetical protein